MSVEAIMIKLYIAIALLIFLPTVSEAAMVPSNVLTRVFFLRLGQDTATGFTIEVDRRQYLITARHVTAATPSASEIEVYHNNAWAKVPFSPIAVEPQSVDIAVLALSQQISELLPIRLGLNKDYFLSQEVFFVGFPYGLTVNGHQLNRGFPLPFVKHGIIAATAGGEGEPFMVDGINLSYSAHSRDSLVGMVQLSGIA
jgi:S1-C subfamily serine protease